MLARLYGRDGRTLRLQSRMAGFPAQSTVQGRLCRAEASGRRWRCDVWDRASRDNNPGRGRVGHCVRVARADASNDIRPIPLPRWVEPQLSKLVEKAPTGPQWVHEIQVDGYRMAVCIERGKVQLLTRAGLDWTERYPETAVAFAQLPVKTAYIDGELCGVRADGVTSFELMQQSTDAESGGLVHFAFDLIELDGEDVARLPLLERKERLARLLKSPPARIVYSEHEGGDGEVFRRAAWRGLQANPPTVPAGRPRRVGQELVPKPRRVRRRRMVRPRRVPPRRRFALARLLRLRRPADLRGARGHGHVRQDAGHAPREACTAGDIDDAALFPSAAKEPFRRLAGPVQSALGATGTRRRDHLSRLDR